MILGIKKYVYRPRSVFSRTLLEIGAISMGLQFGLPVSVSLFNPIAYKKGHEIEEEF